MLAHLHKYEQTKNVAQLHWCGLKPWWPFWAELLHVNFANCITPNLLHQLHKGLFKRYIMDWLEEIIGKDKMDVWFQSMPHAKGLWHFKHSINTISQWTGCELKEMMKQFLPVVIDNSGQLPLVPEDFVKMVHVLLDFLYLAHSVQLTKTELVKMNALLDSFH
jgi:hypothetical protein